jgi:hypothetical protein
MLSALADRFHRCAALPDKLRQQSPSRHWNRNLAVQDFFMGDVVPAFVPAMIGLDDSAIRAGAGKDPFAARIAQNLRN